MKPEEINCFTELDLQYMEAVRKITCSEEFSIFLKKWEYWLDDEVKTFDPKNWEDLKKLIDDCRSDAIIPEEKHNIALALLMPKRIIAISFKANEYKVPWGLMYIRLREANKINY